MASTFVTARAIVFDLNETLLDMSALDPLFADAFGDKSVRRAWYAQTLQNVMSATIIRSYADFGELAKAALEMTARQRGVTIDDERTRRILRGMSALPAHGDVAAGLTRLRDAGRRLAVFTNASEAMVRAQLDHAKLSEYFEVVLSTDAVGRFKPAPEAYAFAAERLEVAPSELLLVAAQAWDVAGAMSAGLDAAFVSRHGTALNPLEPRPSIVAPDVRAIASAIVAREAA
ncbi:MAG: haloacid dehalogenase type II [Candidatus Eremiobacteraeota bacterium]|nr:haloacid dehalogenase type II [Candidatus Eremiobacteraeota bacterium]